MQLTYLKTLLQPGDSVQKVTSLTWAPNNGKFAAVTVEKVVYLFDENGEKKDKFKTKPAESNGSNNYIVRAMAFSPDSTKLAIAQSDNIVFVYRLGDTWTEKKSICNKFLQSSAVTCLTWPKDRPNELVFGLADGKVKLGMLKTNKPYSMYQHPENSYVVSIAGSPSGQAILCGHLDCSIYKYTFPAEEGGVPIGLAQLVIHPSVPYCISWGANIVVAGNDNKVVFYDASGHEKQSMDYSADESLREFTSSAFNPSGDTAVLGCNNKFFIFCYNSKTGWEEVGSKQVDNFYAVTALGWKPDGSKLTVGSLTGAVDMYDACVRRHRYKGKFEFTYVSRSSVIVKMMKTGTRIVLKSLYNSEIEKINVYKDRYLIARTEETLLMGDLETCRLTEIPWKSTGTEKFLFENERVCMVHYNGELSIVEYGRNELLGICRTEHVSPFLLSVVVSEARGRALESKKMAYLIDLQTVRIVDLLTNSTLATVNHDNKIDWLELNQRGTHLLFRDKKRHLHLFSVALQERVTLLNYCQYVQWVPMSDVIVAQSRGNLCVWYSINTPDRQTIFPIKGEVEDIERKQHVTEVIVNEGINVVSYALDEALIYFGSALEDHDFERAVKILEPLELTPETEAHWQQLAALALEESQVAIAERCYAALGDIARTRSLHKVVKMAQEAGELGYESYAVRAKMAQINHEWTVAEQLLLAQGRVVEAIEMYKQALKWDDAVRVSSNSRHPGTEDLKRAYYQWLLDTHQEETAGMVKEQQGDTLGAIALYLKGGLPARAAQVVMNSNISFDAALIESILSALAKANLFERAGELYEFLGRTQEAASSYRRGHAYRKAIDLAKRVDPSTITEIEEEWGDWLMTQKQMDGAINHFVEANQPLKAIEAAIQCRQFAKAAAMVVSLDPIKAMPYFKRIAQHYETINNLEEAERYFIKANMAMDAVDMYSRAGRWDAAQKVARGYLTDEEMRAFYRKKGRELEAQHKFKEAEKAFIQCEEYDMAIAMYKKNKMYDPMIRMVQLFRKDQLQQAHQLVAQQLESEGNLRDAEKHYVEGKDWKSAVQMYRAHDMWEDALRVAKVYGGINASKQVAYAWAISLGGDEGAVLLKRIGLLDQAIDYAIESGAFAQAFELTRAAGAKNKLPEVHLKYAMFLEDEGRFGEAEVEFLNAGKPKEAIDMYIHNQDWDAAMRIAEQYDSACINDVLVAQARAFATAKNFQMGEALYIKAQRPELALKMYREARIWNDALRLAEDYLPSKVAEIQLEMQNIKANPNAPNVTDNSAESLASKAKGYERNNDFARAIEAYLAITKNDTPNHDALEQWWEQAANLAMNYQRHRLSDVVSTVSFRLMEIGRFQAAAELHESIDDVQGAIRAYCSGRMFEKARALAGNNPKLSQYVEDQATQDLVSNSDAAGLEKSGKSGQAIELYAQRDEWDQVHKLAGQQGPEQSAMYAARHAERCFKKGEYGEAASVLAKYGMAASPAYFDLYRGIAVGVLTATMAERRLDAESSLKEMMYRLLLLLQGGNAKVSKKDNDDFTKVYWAAHYIVCASNAKAKGLREIAAKELTSVLRYVGIVPADRAFYEAGTAWKEAGRLNMSFVLLNRYLDLMDAMEDPDSSAAVIENADFAETDIPFDFSIPERHYAKDDKKEEVRNFVLELSMDQQVEQTLSTRTCDKCGTETFEGNLTCHNCKHILDMCSITGYPIPPHEKIVSRGNGIDVPARRDDWNTWVKAFSICPVTGAPVSPQF